MERIRRLSNRAVGQPGYYFGKRAERGAQPKGVKLGFPLHEVGTRPDDVRRLVDNFETELQEN